MTVSCNGHASIGSEYAPNPGGHGNMSKVDRYKWKIVDAPGRFCEIDKHSINIDYSYQRKDVSSGNILSISSRWSWLAFGCILVVERADGSYWAYDGQHRVLAARNRHDITKLPCLVFRSAEVASEAAGFVQANKNRKPVNAITKYTANIVAKDPVAVRCDAVLREFGISVDKSAKVPGQIACIDACLLIASDSETALRRSLSAALRVCVTHPIMKPILCGLHWIDQNYELLGDEKFLSRLSQYDSSTLMASVRKFQDAHNKSSIKLYGQAILSVVNRGLRRKYGSSGE